VFAGGASLSAVSLSRCLCTCDKIVVSHAEPLALGQHGQRRSKARCPPRPSRCHYPSKSRLASSCRKASRTVRNPTTDHARNRSAEPPPRLVLSPHPRLRLSRRGRSNGRAEGLPSVDDLAQTGDDSPQFSPRFWTCRFGIAGGHSPPFGCRLVCVRFPLIWFTSNEPDQGLFVRHSSLRPPVPCGVSVSWSSVFLSLVTRLSA